MAELRYSELKYNGGIITEQWKIDEILIKNKFNWLVNAEIKNARLEIFQDTLVWNAGIWYNGDWFFGVWRDGEWRYGNWQNGVWYNGVWRNGTFKSGIIYNGKFFKGKIEGGEIRGGQFIDCEIASNVVEYAGDEYQEKQKEIQQKQVATTAVAQPQPVPTTDVVKVHGTPPASQQPIEQPRVQQENNQYKMENKINEKDRNWLNQKYSIEMPNSIADKHTENWENEGIEFEISPDKAWDNPDSKIYSFPNFDSYEKAYKISKKIELEEDKATHWGEDFKKTDYVPGWLTGWYSNIHKAHGLLGTKSMRKIAPFFAMPNNNENNQYKMRKMKDFGKFIKENVGELEDSFIDVNIDETELKTSDRPKGKLNQKAGKIIIETPSKTDAYNAIMRLGGDIIVDPNYSDEKQIHTIKSTK